MSLFYLLDHEKCKQLENEFLCKNEAIQILVKIQSWFIKEKISAVSNFFFQCFSYSCFFEPWSAIIVFFHYRRTNIPNSHKHFNDIPFIFKQYSVYWPKHLRNLIREKKSVPLQNSNLHPSLQEKSLCFNHLGYKECHN